MLSFSVGETGKVINIALDAQGMATLMRALAKLVGERAGHVHLRSPPGGGADLNEKTPWDQPAISEVIIDYAEGD
jgi:hypothetical protein